MGLHIAVTRNVAEIAPKMNFILSTRLWMVENRLYEFIKVGLAVLEYWYSPSNVSRGHLRSFICTFRFNHSRADRAQCFGLIR